MLEVLRRVTLDDKIGNEEEKAQVIYRWKGSGSR